MCELECLLLHSLLNYLEYSICVRKPLVVNAGDLDASTNHHGIIGNIEEEKWTCSIVKSNRVACHLINLLHGRLASRLSRSTLFTSLLLRRLNLLINVEAE